MFSTDFSISGTKDVRGRISVDRAALGRVLEATNKALDRARDVVTARLDGGELDRAVELALREVVPPTHGSSSTAAPASSGSTPVPSP